MSHVAEGHDFKLAERCPMCGKEVEGPETRVFTYEQVKSKKDVILATLQRYGHLQPTGEGPTPPNAVLIALKEAFGPSDAAPTDNSEHHQEIEGSGAE